MRATKLIAGLFGVAFVLCIGTAFATETVVIGGFEFTCPSTCVIVNGPDGSVTITDAEGGPVKTRIKPRNVTKEN